MCINNNLFGCPVELNPAFFPGAPDVWPPHPFAYTPADLPGAAGLQHHHLLPALHAAHHAAAAAQVPVRSYLWLPLTHNYCSSDTATILGAINTTSVKDYDNMFRMVMAIMTSPSLISQTRPMTMKSTLTKTTQPIPTDNQHNSTLNKNVQTATPVVTKISPPLSLGSLPTCTNGQEEVSLLPHSTYQVPLPPTILPSPPKSPPLLSPALPQLSVASPEISILPTQDCSQRPQEQRHLQQPGPNRHLTNHSLIIAESVNKIHVSCSTWLYREISFLKNGQFSSQKYNFLCT